MAAFAGTFKAEFDFEMALAWAKDIKAWPRQLNWGHLRLRDG
jgi:hypothetical protein